MGFIPSQDIGQINGQTEMAQGLGFESMVEHQLEVMEIIRADPNVRSVTSSIGVGGGGGGGGAANGGRLQIELKPRAERELTADEVIAALRPKLAAVPGVRVFLTEPAGHQHRRPRRRARSTSSRCRAATPTSCTPRRRQLEAASCTTMPGLSTSRATCCSPTRRSTSRSTASASPRSG